MPPPLSIIVPTLNEASVIAAVLQRLRAFREEAEVIVADGGSEDGTREAAKPLADRVIVAPRGRASQMNAGAKVASGDVLLFLHADSILPGDAPRLVREGLERSRRGWGRFDVTIAGADPLLAVVAIMMNARSRLTGIATGDQAVFARREAFETVGGFPEIPLMEDVELSRRLKRVSKPLCLRERVVTSGRRWERNGTLRTIVLMWRLRFAYAMGVDPRRLARRYEVERTSS
ncbi:MAG: TIGR04283 family arsenosugar biosynthesis glycosyltransferase [Bacillota bacterium]